MGGCVLGLGRSVLKTGSIVVEMRVEAEAETRKEMKIVPPWEG